MGVFSPRRLEDCITPAHLVEGLSGLHRAGPLRSHRPHAPSRSAARGCKANWGVGQGRL